MRLFDRISNIFTNKKKTEGKKTLNQNENNPISNLKTEKRNFIYLDDLIHSGKKEISLDYDISFGRLSKKEKIRFLIGQKLDVDDLIIDGNGHTIDAENQINIFTVRGKNITIKNLTLKNGKSSGNGGAVVIYPDVNIKFINTKFINNKSAMSGGAIFNWGNLILEKCDFINNKANDDGGAISNEKNATLNIIDSNFNENSSKNDGGAIFNCSNIEITKCNFKNNKSNRNGGSINNQRSSSINISATKFIENKAKKDGGAITNFSQIFLNEDCCFNENNAGNHGSALNNQPSGVLDINDAIFTKNHANVATILNSGKLTLKDSKLEENYSNEIGGAIINLEGSTLISSDSKFINNSSKQEGSSIYNLSNNVEFNNCSFTNHNIKNSIICNCSVLNFYDCKFVNNISNNNIINIVGDSLISSGNYQKNKTNILFSDCIFEKNNSNILINNDNDNSYLKLSSGKITNNQINNTVIKHDGKKCTINQTIFEDNNLKDSNYEIINNSKMILEKPRFTSNTKTIDNFDYIKVGMSKKEVEKYILMEANSSIEYDELEQEHKNKYNLNYLLGQIKKYQKEKTFILKENIKFEKSEFSFYSGGIELDEDNFTLDGNNKTIDANNDQNDDNYSRIFLVTGKNIILKNITFKNGLCLNNYDKHTSGGGAINIIKGASLTIENCHFINCFSDDDGGALLNNGHLTIKNCFFENNKANNYGGAINNRNHLTILSNEFKRNTSKIGGSIYNSGHLIINENNVFINNQSDFKEPIYNSNVISCNHTESIDKLIYNTSEINFEEKNIETFTYLNNLIKKLSNEEILYLEKDIIFNYKMDEKLITGIDLNKKITINGNNHSIDGKQIGTLFNVNSKIILKNLTIKNFYSEEQSIIENNNELVLENCKFLNNRVTYNKNLINNSNSLNISNTEFLNNFSKNKSLINNKKVLKISKSIFVNNESNADGGLIHNEKMVNLNKPKTIIENVIFINNVSKRGIILNRLESTLNICGSDFNNNNSITSGLIINMGKCFFETGKFIKNMANTGGAFDNQGYLNIKKTEFIDNRAEIGGAIANSGEIQLIDNKFIGNIASLSGGAIQNQIIPSKSNKIDVIGCTFRENVPNNVVK